MNNKLVKLIVVFSFFPLLLIGCNKTSSSQNNLESSESSNYQQYIDDSQSQKLLNNNQLLIVVIITLILNLGSIGLIIWLILYNKNNQQIIKDLKLELKYYNSQIKKGEISNNKRKYEIEELRQQIIDQFNETTELKLVNLYKKNPQSFLSNYNAIRVSMTKDTINKVFAGKEEGVIELEVDNRQGQFYIVNNHNEEFYLFLNTEILFNPPTLQHINKSKLFICNGNLSQTLKGSEVNVIKPAIVIQDNQKWRLIQSGEIDLNNENIEDNDSVNHYSFIDIESKPVINSTDTNIDNQLIPIYQKIQDIDKQLKELQKASQRIIISGGKSNPQPKPINIAEGDLINLYNYAPQILAEYATSVSITAETYRNKNQGKIYLEYTINGYYWVILREQNNKIFYHLLPNGNKQINLHRLQNQLELLFIIEGQKESNNDFSLEKLGYLVIEPSGNLWQLTNKGIIKINTIVPIKKSQSLINSTTIKHQSDNSSFSNKELYQELDRYEQYIINEYYNNSHFLTDYGYKVTPTQKSLQNIYLNQDTEIIFQASNQGDYWIVQLKNMGYYLLPDLKLTINTNVNTNFITGKTIFELKNYKQSSKNFIVIKPAKVDDCNQNQWQLLTKGILNFNISQESKN